MLTNAKKTDGGYVLNGSKMWITNGTIAILLLFGLRMKMEMLEVL